MSVGRSCHDEWQLSARSGRSGVTDYGQYQSTEPIEAVPFF